MHLIDLTVDSTDGVLVATAAVRGSLSDAISVFTKACEVAAEWGLDLTRLATLFCLKSTSGL